MRATVSTFRRAAVAEEQMIRASMPLTSAADPMPLRRNGEERATIVVANHGSSRLVSLRPVVTFTLGDVARVL